MSDGSLSQDEIDALLQGSGGFDAGEKTGKGGGTGLSAEEKKSLTSFLGGIIDSQASNLSSMVGETVSMGKPVVEVTDAAAFIASLPEQIVEIAIPYEGALSGSHGYIMNPEVATTIAGFMMGQEGVELNEAALSALEEAGNTLAGSAVTSISDSLGQDVRNAPAQTKISTGSDLVLPEGKFVKVSYTTTINGKEPSELIEIFDMSLAKGLSGGDEPADGGMEDLMAAAGGGGGGDLFPSDSFGLGGGGGQSASMPQQGGGSLFGGPAAGGGGGFGPGPSVQPVQFPNLYPQSHAGDQGNISLLMDVYMEMTVELGRTKRLIKEILGMGEGTIIELDKLAGEPVDILVNRKLIAKGEVVVIDENFGVRVTEIVSPMDRMGDMT
ncbi:MAG: flagellar motor switch protein FliN [Spirochaetales bacterium]|nr:flagellar motor switch protein FliN [Spirochaetales bacterium]